VIELTNSDIQMQAIQLVRKIVKKQFNNGKHNFVKIYGVPRGGIPIAYLLRGHFLEAIVVDDPKEADFIVDDILDSGETKRRYESQYKIPFYTLYDKPNEWISFPWEKKDNSTPLFDNILRIEQFLDSANYEEKVTIFESLNNIIKSYK